MLSHEMTWTSILSPVRDTPLLQKPLTQSMNDRAQGIIVFPKEKEVFAAFTATPFSDIRAVIVGQDPYHDENQAEGLAFSVPHGVPIPPSLRNIFRELVHDVGVPPPTSGHLLPWARQGVFLLNSTLTVTAHQAGSHSNYGWQAFTDYVISSISTHHPHVVFLLWGNHARSKKSLIDPRHTILEAPHPSPLSAHQGFFGCRHFSRTNETLDKHAMPMIDWKLP